MKAHFCVVSTASIALAISACTAARHAVTPAERADAEREVTAVFERAERAVSAKDFVGLADMIALDGQATHVGTDANETLLGGQALVEGEKQALGQLDAVKISHANVRVLVSRDASAAWLFANEDYDLSAGGKTITMRGVRVTWGLEKRDGKWKIVQTHCSLGAAPQLGNAISAQR
jgi:uncharacterized protein (TIGR02246 family)